MAEDNRDQAREMAGEGARTLRHGNASEGRELIEEARRLDRDAVAGIAPESDVPESEEDAAVDPAARAAGAS